jgi:diacylglycerol kinase (ATP)
LFIKLLKSFAFAFRGIKILVSTQQNARIHLAITILVVVAGIIFNINRSDWLWIVVAIVLVFVTECLNSAIEYLANVTSPEFHPLIEKAKDMAAGAVLIAAIAATLIGILVFYPYIFD